MKEQSGKSLAVEDIGAKNMNVVTLKNEGGFIVASLYVLHNGNLHADSWLWRGLGFPRA